MVHHVTSVDLAPLVFKKVALLAKAWRLTPGEAVGRLVEEFESDIRDAGPPSPITGRHVRVHAEYHGTRVEGIYDRAQRTLSITSGPGAGKQFGSPSAAAIFVVTQLNPG